MELYATVEPLPEPVPSDVPPIIDRVPSDYPLTVGVSYLGATRRDGRRMITAIDGDTITYTLTPSYRNRIETTRLAFTDWAVEVYLGSPLATLLRPAGFVEPDAGA